MDRNWYTHFTAFTSEFLRLVEFLNQTEIHWDADQTPEGYYFHLCLNDDELDAVCDFIYADAVLEE